MTNTRQFLHGAAWSGATVLINMIALLAVGKMATNALSSDDVGLFALLLTCCDFVTVFLSVGLSSTMPKLVAGSKSSEDQSSIIGSVLLFEAAVTAAGVALAMAATQLGGLGLYAGLPEPWRSLSAYLWIMPLLFGVGVFRDLFLAIQAGLDQYANRATAMALGSIAQVGLIYLFIWRFGHGSVTALVVCLSAGYILGLFWSGRVIRAHTSFARGISNALGAVRFSLPMHANTLLVFIYQRTDTLVVGALLGLGPAAILEMIKRLPMMLTRVLGATLVPYLPSISKCIASNDSTAAARLAGRASRTVVFLGHAACLAALVVREPLIRLLFSDYYVAGAGVLCLLFFAAVLSLQSGILTQALIAMGRNKAIVVINCAVVAIGVGGNFLLDPWYGLQGVGVAAVGAILVGTLAQALWLRKSGLSLPWKNVLTPHLCMLPAALLSFPSESWSLRLSALLFFLAGSVILRVIRYDDLNAVIQAMRPTKTA